MEKKDEDEKRLPGESEEDPDSYIRTLAAPWGHLDLIKEWMEHHKHERERVTELVLFPAAMYGQLEVLEYALPFGDMTQRDTNPRYLGWNLMHFAVEGIYMNFPHDQEENVSPGACNDIVPGAPGSQPRTQMEVRWRQMDIILKLANCGVPLTCSDQQGYTASSKACSPQVDKFLEGALLLDILAVTMAGRGQEGELETPGLALCSIPQFPGWKNATQQLVEWAYSRRQQNLLTYPQSKKNKSVETTDILKFCHDRKIVDLGSPQLVLSNTQRPLLMDALRRNDYALFQIIMDSQGDKSAPDIIMKVYEYDFGNTGKWRESPLSFACRMHSEGNRQILESFLSPQAVGTQLTHITLAEIGLRHLPADLFHENLKTLDARGNNLSDLPRAIPELESLNWNCPQLKVFNISNNLFQSIHPDLFQLPSLTKLIAAGNQIKTLSKRMWSAPSLQHLDLSSNQISSLPCPATMLRARNLGFRYSMMSLACTSFSSLYSSDSGFLPSVRQSYINLDVQSSEELHKSQSGFGLTTLDLTANQLTGVPIGLSCLAPLLNTLKLGKNQITDLGNVQCYPPLLQTFDANQNAITSGIKASDNLAPAQCFQSQFTNVSSTCHHCNHQKLSHLKFLYVSNNQLEDLPIDFESVVSDYSVEPENRHSPEVKLLFPRLQGLRLSKNRLKEVPANIHKLDRLCELAIDGNPNIRRLPLDIHRLTNLFTFKYQGIGDPIVHELAKFKNTADILYYLRARKTSACPNSSLRLFIIGHYHKGKTTLLSSLRGKPPDSGFDQRAKRIHNEADDGTLSLTQQDVNSTVGIECGKWLCRKNGSSRNSMRITFYSWDFAGQEEYYLTHQCFFTNRALYVLVWDVNDGDRGIESLGIWLQNLQVSGRSYETRFEYDPSRDQAKAPGSTIVIVGTHLDNIPRAEQLQRCKGWFDKLEKYRIGRWQSKGFPQIKSILFVGCPPRKRPIGIETLNDVLYEVAMNMDSPKDAASKIPSSLKIKILQEKIPESYDRLRKKIEVLAETSRQHKTPPILHKDEFCEKVRDIIHEQEEVETAVNFLHTTTGVVLHFNMPVLIDYYIVDPQRWFDLCALVISPDNVSKLVRQVGPYQRCGFLSSSRMDKEFSTQGYPPPISQLVRTFLRQYHIVHQINEDSYLVPSAIQPHPGLVLNVEQGSFPGQGFSLSQGVFDNDDEQLPSLQVGPAINRRRIARDIEIEKSGLVYRRILHLPPIASGFWSKLISLFIQKPDFQHIVHTATPGRFSLHQGAIQQLLCMIGNVSLQWHYWKTGIILFLEEQMLLRVNSLRCHEFEDPQKQMVLSETQKKVKFFHFRGSAGWQFIPSQYTEVIEVIVPDVRLHSEASGDPNLSHQPMSAKILTKALEIIDEVLKNHCEHLAMTGIYTINDMLHVIPCPLCFGDNDTRGTYQHPAVQHPPDVQDNQSEGLPLDPVEPPPDARKSPELNSIYVFTVDECIMKTFISDNIECPEHGKLEFQHLVPDLVFSDLADVKLDKKQLNAPIDRNEEPQVGCKGSFGAVFKRLLNEDAWAQTEVAVKIFEQFDAGLPDSVTELTKNYSDMRYELNKLSSLHHSYIVRFIGVFTNPHCFVLEWAPKMSLEAIRQGHATSESNLCPLSIILVLLQVTEALAYLHDTIGIVHNDLKCSNILVFEFPDMGHSCCDGGECLGCSPCLAQPARCGVLVKLADMGICANPAARRNKNFAGIRQFVPEVLNFDSSFTEKVDIFTLGTCLYELMTLRGLPPSDMLESEYKFMLQTGKRPQFYMKDAPYPLLLFQFLEECWQQEHFRRPSAKDLNKTLQVLTGLQVREETVNGSCKKILMDTFVAHQSYRMSATHAVVNEDAFILCAAFQSPEESTTSIAIVEYQVIDDEETGVEMKAIEEIKNTHVTAIHMTPKSEILVACSDGKLLLFVEEGTHTCNPSDMCSSCHDEHGEIVGLYYDSTLQTAVIGFASGRVHINLCFDGIRSIVEEGQYCNSLSQGLPWLHAMQCISHPPSTLEVWCGTESNQLEIWSFSINPDAMWDPNSVDLQITTVCLASHINGQKTMVKQMKPNHDSTLMVVFLHQQGSKVMVLVDVLSKAVVKSVHCDLSVSSFVTSPTKFVIGTYLGAVYLYDADKVLYGNTQSLASLQPEVLNAHFSTVYSLHCLEGHVSPNGLTSFFPTFVGKTAKPSTQEFLISIGYGKGYPELKHILKSSIQQRGSCLNAWII